MQFLVYISETEAFRANLKDILQFFVIILHTFIVSNNI